MVEILTDSQAPQIKIDLGEAEGKYTLKAEIPGVKKEDIDMRIDGSLVSIGAEVKNESAEKKDGRVLHLALPKKAGTASRKLTIGQPLAAQRRPWHAVRPQCQNGQVMSDQDRSTADGALVEFRPARLSEAPAMAGMSRTLIEAGLAWRYTPPRMAALIGDPDTVALVACEGATLCGLAAMHFGEARAHLLLLCVDAAQQRRGIGRRLVDWLIASAQVAGIGSVGLELRADNPAALAFYRRLGFVETRLVPGYYDGRIAARRMQRALGAAAALP